MSKLLSIIIPRYKETESQIFPLLSSISNSVNVNWNELEVVVGNDGGGAKPLTSEFLQQFNMKVRQVKLKTNKGVGLARQAAIDEAEGKWIFFCDADDCIYSVLSISQMIEQIRQHPDSSILCSDFLEELSLPNGKYVYKQHQGHVGCWMHGKAMNLDWLRSNSIQFNPKFREHEDAYFLVMSYALSRETRYIPDITYVWKCNEKSITRVNNHAYTYYSAPVYIDAVTTAMKELKERKPETLNSTVCQLIYYHYFMLQRPDWMTEENKEYKKKAEEALTQMVTPWLTYYIQTPIEEKLRQYNNARSIHFSQWIESEALDQFVDRLFSKSFAELQKTEEALDAQDDTALQPPSSQD